MLDLLTSAPGEEYATKGLIEKVDVLGQIPYLLKKFVNYAAGTKPYIYTVRYTVLCRRERVADVVDVKWLNQATASITVPSTPAPLTVEGLLFNEATFVS